MNTDWPFGHYELPRLDQLNDNLVGASFFLMKLMPAKYMLQEAEKKGELKSASKIVETTSGTFGLALAMLSAVKGYDLVLFSDPAIDDRLLRRLKDLGAKVEIIEVENPAKHGGYQKLRLDRLLNYLEENPDAFWPQQYKNVGNPLSYSKLAEYLIESIGQIDVLVGPVGSGGSMVGTSTYLKRIFPKIEVIGVDTPNSVLFGQPDGKRLLRGLGNSILPQNLDHQKFDKVSWVPSSLAFKATRMLHQRHGLFMGGTSGASYLVAKWYAKENPFKTVVSLFPDEGHRYVDTIYNENWLNRLPDYEDYPLPDSPKLIKNPTDDLSNWTVLNWDNQDLGKVMKNI